MDGTHQKKEVYGEKRRKDEVEEIQYLRSLASKNGFVKQIWPLPDCTATRSDF